MTDSWLIRIYEQKKLVYTADLTGPVELGRQSSAEELLYSQHLVLGRRRLVIGSKDERSVSRQQALLEPIAEGGFRLTNLSNGSPMPSARLLVLSVKRPGQPAVRSCSE
jgi:hypothetical protein